MPTLILWAVNLLRQMPPCAEAGVRARELEVSSGAAWPILRATNSTLTSCRPDEAHGLHQSAAARWCGAFRYCHGMGDLVEDGTPRDSELVRAAQAGDAGCLGLLLARHRAGMYAVALAVLGHSPDAEDAVQEAALVALRRIGEVRDPGAFGPWLRMVVRNACRAQLRRVRAVPVAELSGSAAMDWPEGPPDPAEVLDRHALRDWVWSALEDLSPGLRLVTMLRYFTGVTSYEDIAALCAVPVGTVRSRLHEARAKLSDSLMGSAERVHDDATARTALHRRLAEETMASAHRGQIASALSERWSPQAEVTWPTGKRTGIGYLGTAFDRDLSGGVRHELRNVVASRGVVIWEAALLNPPEDPFHCPPSVVWVHFLDRDCVNEVRLYHPRAR